MFGFAKIMFYLVVISLLNWSYAELSAEDDSSVQARLVGDTKGTGRLEVFTNGYWYPVVQLSQNDAIVACRMLGFHDSGMVNIFSNNIFGQNSDYKIYSSFNCDSTETSLDKCSSPQSWNILDRPGNINLALSCEASQIRLVDGDDSASGRVELFILNNWYTVCDDDFDFYDAYVICRMLGYNQSGVSRAYSEGHYGQGYGGMILSKLKCDGSERDLKECQSQWGTNNNCDHREDAGVSCSNTQIRLVDGPTNTSGRVEVFHAGNWGTICSSGGFTTHDIKVICNMVGVTNPNAFGYSFAYYGEGHGYIMFDKLVCDGSESDISQCSTGVWSSTSNVKTTCNHASDVGVNCEGKTPVRLKDGDSEQSGRVEVFNQGQWGSVSDDYFGRNDLEVICRMLGYTFSSRSFIISDGYYGQGTGRVLVSKLNCDGDESDIGHCSGTWWPNTGSLSHSDDVGISCDGNILTKLVTVDSDPAGRVEFYHDGYYHTICGREFDRADLMVICRMLGVENIPRSAYWRYNPTFNQGIGEIGASHLKCDGTESSIPRCGAYMPAATTGVVSHCDHSFDISVNCKGDPEHLRLVGGNTNHSGTVEINVSGNWGTICDAGFDRLDAIVICRVLGYPRPERAIAYSDAHFGQGNVSILLSNLQCNGVETNIGTCYPSYNTYGCYHRDDIGVDCCPNCDVGGQIVG